MCYLVLQGAGAPSLFESTRVVLVLLEYHKVGPCAILVFRSVPPGLSNSAAFVASGHSPLQLKKCAQKERTTKQCVG